VADPSDLLGALVETKLAKSRGDARRLVDQGGVRINGEKVGVEARLADGDVLQAGKRNFVRIRVR
jgi:tyrosyl-tRNA synthetase